MTWLALAGGVASVLTILGFLIGAFAWLLRRIVSAIDDHTVNKLDPRFDALERRLDDQDHALDLQSQELLRLAGRTNITPFRRTSDGRG